MSEVTHPSSETLGEVVSPTSLQGHVSYRYPSRGSQSKSDNVHLATPTTGTDIQPWLKEGPPTHRRGRLTTPSFCIATVECEPPTMKSLKGQKKVSSARYPGSISWLPDAQSSAPIFTRHGVRKSVMSHSMGKKVKLKKRGQCQPPGRSMRRVR